MTLSTDVERTADSVFTDTMCTSVMEGLMSVTKELIKVAVGLMYVTEGLMSVTERLILLCDVEGLMTVIEDCAVSIAAGDISDELFTGLCADVLDTMRGKRTADISSLVCDDVIDVDVEPVICNYGGSSYTKIITGHQ